MAKKLRFTLPLLAVFLFMGLCISPTFAAKPVRVESPIIISVQHVYDTGVLTITGENLSESTTMPVVTLDGKTLDVGSGPWGATQIIATATNGFPDPGDYELLFDSTLKGTEPVKMMLTLGAVGPAGTDGADGAPGDDGTDGAKGDTGDPGISLPITCESGEALKGIDEAGLPVCVPLSAVRVEGGFTTVGIDARSVVSCPTGSVVDRAQSGFFFKNMNVYPGECELFESHVQSSSPDTIECEITYAAGSICLSELKCVAVCEPA